MELGRRGYCFTFSSRTVSNSYLPNVFVAATAAAPPAYTSITGIARPLPSSMKRSYRHHAETEQSKRRKVSLRDGMLDAAGPFREFTQDVSIIRSCICYLLTDRVPKGTHTNHP